MTKYYHAEWFELETMLRMRDYRLDVIETEAQGHLREAWDGSARAAAMALVIQSVHLTRMCRDAIEYELD